MALSVSFPLSKEKVSMPFTPSVTKSVEPSTMTRQVKEAYAIEFSLFAISHRSFWSVIRAIWNPTGRFPTRKAPRWHDNGETASTLRLRQSWIGTLSRPLNPSCVEWSRKRGVGSRPILKFPIAVVGYFNIYIIRPSWVIVRGKLVSECDINTKRI